MIQFDDPVIKDDADLIKWLSQYFDETSHCFVEYVRRQDALLQRGNFVAQQFFIGAHQRALRIDWMSPTTINGHGKHYIRVEGLV